MQVTILLPAPQQASALRPWIDMAGASIRGERLRSSARTLVRLLRPGAAGSDRVRALLPQVWEDVFALALQQNLAPLLQRALQTNDALAELPEHLRTRLEQQRRATALDNLRNYGGFRRIARALHARGIPFIALKGLHLSELVYRDISLRPMSDLDILVPQSQVEPAIAALSALDFELNGGVSSGYDIALTDRSLDILVEVHWALAQPGEPSTPAVEDIWRLAVPSMLADVDALVMPPEFLLLHVCVHLAYHNLFTVDLRALCDIAEVARAHPDLDWAAVVDHARRRGCARGVAAALRLARDHLGAAVPEEVLAALGADTLAPELLAAALEQLGTFSGLPYELQFAPNLAALKSPIGWRGKLAKLWNRIFVPRAELALIYGVPERSAWIKLYYVLRLRDLVRRYASSAWEMNDFGADLAAAAARKVRLERWISGD